MFWLEHFEHSILKSLSEAGFMAIVVADKMVLMMARVVASWVGRGVYDPFTGDGETRGDRALEESMQVISFRVGTSLNGRQMSSLRNLCL